MGDGNAFINIVRLHKVANSPTANSSAQYSIPDIRLIEHLQKLERKSLAGFMRNARVRVTYLSEAFAENPRALFGQHVVAVLNSKSQTDSATISEK